MEIKDGEHGLKYISKLTEAELLKAKIDLLNENVMGLTMDYVRLKAEDKTVKSIKVDMPSNHANVHPDEFNGWQCDWWGAEPVEIAGRMWNVFGSAWYGSIQYTEVED
ncbi:MAG: hypothetical protein ACRC0G_02470 [Fusobacteriaceae bacterium]